MSTTTNGRIEVVKRDGTRVPYDGYEIARSIEEAAAGLDDGVARATQLRSELEITLFDGITSEQLDEAVVQVALQNVKDDPAYDTIASRLLVKSLYKGIFGEGVTRDEVYAFHGEAFVAFVLRGVELGLLDRRLGELFDLERLGAALDPDRDDLLRYVGVQTMRTRYMVAGPDGRPLEMPQFFWMRVAMGLALNEDDPTRAAERFYDKMSRLEYLAAGSTLVNAGTSYSQLSNCFVMQMEDEIEHIAKSVRDVMWLTKGTGGIGLSVTKLRAEGSPIASNNTTSTGPIPFMHTIDSTLRAVSRGGKKFGALCFYMENWHLDFPAFLDLRQNSGDPYRRTRTANTAVWISDEFMKRVEADQPWYLFDPAEVPDLVELTGAAFSRRYAEYAAEAEAGRLRHRKVGAREQFRAILTALQSTSHPWLTWKDTINTRALNHNTGTIHLSNLCTEICLPQDRENVAVCNLASINLSRHVVGRRRGAGGEGARIDWDRLAESTRLAVRQLDNLIDITVSSVPESEHSNERNRALGLGVMGFTDVVERCGYSYASPEAYELIDRVMEFVSWHAIDASADLARERGSYAHFPGSRWSQGLVPIDSLALLEADRGVPVEVDRTTRLDWHTLREKVAGGIRNSTLLAIAPTASIGLVAGTTPGLDPQFSQIFSRTTSSGKFLEVNRNLVEDLRAAGLWEEVRDDLLRHQGDLARVAAERADLTIPRELVEIYQTSFQLPGRAYLEVAARAQKWIDQAISRNIYLADRSVASMVELYAAAWRMGVKTTYYLHMMPRHTAEQSTVKVNKAEGRTPASSGARRGFGAAAPARRGFGAAAPAAPVVPAVVPDVVPDDVQELEVVGEAACPVDPQERLQCESCQ
ncbi:ribonucleoside-diphosphate reductase alpha chain [Nocardioides zeae]|uniref:Ribonucleoside-diphosphate reductase alpha chain n=1 Tax=Nocardioides zeae TaxID=1457234 RepID=A0ACC6IF59_9ACTN|nr:ribonucleoside-diphosphate reductase subunit alpha [Nocardioides zeae]MDR6176393.1 ribonucleoside-diphosphate reductase alpha chain [Nocardioides zeae]MDR6209406.1 ribonucleoside-diphosphate reductase alpha chain [Nocardioides zeae]